MKHVKSWLALGLAAVMTIGVVGCGNKEQQETKEASKTGTESSQVVESSSKEETPEVKDPVTLEWWYRGNGVQKDTELVNEEFNKLLQTYPGMEHVTVHFNCFTGSDYANAVALAQSAGQQIDILNSVYLNFVDQVKMGSYISLNDLLESYPDMKATLPDWLWDLGSVDGEIYMVPHYQRAANQEYLLIPKVYWDKYADQEAITAMCENPNRTVAECADVLGAFVAAVQEGEGATKYAPSYGQTWTHSHGLIDRFDNISNDFVLFEGDTKVTYLYTSEKAKQAYEIAAKWYEEGYIHPDALTTTETDLNYANMLNPVSYCYSFQNGAGPGEDVAAGLSDAYGFDVVALPLWDDYFIQNSWGAGGDGITPSCEHPEEAMRLLELMVTEEGKELYNMVVYGLEGRHYEKIDDNHIKTLEYDGSQGGADTSYAAMKWIMGNTFNAYLNQGCSDKDNEIALEINESPDNATSSIMGFRVDVTAVQSQIEQVKAVASEYLGTLKHGVAGSAKWEATYNEYVDKLNKAGLQDVLDEIQRQVDEFWAANK